MSQEFPVIEGKYITFGLGREEYGISLSKIHEILGPEGIQALEKSEPCVRGVMKIRNQMVRVLDLRCRFGLATDSLKEGSAVLVTAFAMDGVLIGLMVDSIRQLLLVKTGYIKKVTFAEGDPRAEFIVGMIQTEGREVLLLNPDKGVDLLPSLTPA